MHATASTPTADAPPIDAQEFLRSVDAWIWLNAHRCAKRLQMQPEELVHEVRVEVFLHINGYDPARGSRTGWTMWRIRKVVMLTLRRMRKERRATPFSQVGSQTAPRSKDYGETFEHDGRRRPAPVGCEIEREDDQAELRRVVGEAVADLREGWAARVTEYFGLGGEGTRSTYQEMADEAGVTRSAIQQSVIFGCKALAADGRLARLAQRHGLTPAAG